ncbi:hypothetical protein PROSTU_02985 [Providencia stuartii ATCC 25827]|uniref:Uncharacterized protein n=1 Tax=Providencia stuartii ATCC 25827 TaxID=471874 RepID=A0AA87CUM4_PROST|nr:hypothetical protein PROSTU_02985 [Providencia stuartii ATCC 25827]
MLFFLPIIQAVSLLFVLTFQSANCDTAPISQSKTLYNVIWLLNDYDITIN